MIPKQLINEAISEMMAKLIQESEDQNAATDIPVEVEIHGGFIDLGIAAKERELIIEMLEKVDWKAVGQQKEQWNPNDWKLVLEEAGFSKENIQRSENISWNYVAFDYILPEGFIDVFWHLLDAEDVTLYQNISYEFAIKHRFDIVEIYEYNHKLSPENRLSYEKHYRLATMFSK